jgi:neutral ceramidase
MTTKLRFIKTVALIGLLFITASLHAQTSGKSASKAGLAKTAVAIVPSNGRGGLKTGAAKVDITPTEQELLAAKSLGAVDRIHARAIVVSNGITSAALVSIDAGGVSAGLFDAVTKRSETELKIPAGNVIINATHTHSSARISNDKMIEYVYGIIKTAYEKMEPATMSWGTGVSYINVNRNIFDKDRRTWWEGPNYDGQSDKTVAVVTFKNIKGDPIAVYYNYAMHAVAAGQLDMVCGDAPGATSNYIEDSFDNSVVALWSEGACGDQNPLFFQQTFDLRDIRIADYASRGEDISNRMPPGGTGLDRNNPKVAKLMNQQKEICQSMGQMLGEEVMHVMRTVKRSENSIRITSAQQVIKFPGRRQLNPGGRAGYQGQYEDADSVSAKLFYLQIEDIALCAMGSEVYNEIAVRLKKESPFARTIMVTVANGGSNTGYIPSDVAYGYQTFEVLSSRIKPGYAESGIVNGFLDLMQKTKY